MTIGCVDVGGGVRDIYGAGVFDYFMDEGITFDLCVGVSAGSANCASYIAGQRGRNKRFYLDYLLRKEAIGPGIYLHTGSFVDLNYVYGTFCNEGGEDPLDYVSISESKTDFTIVATDAKAGRAAYFDKHADMAQNDYRILMASSCLPVFCKPVTINDRQYYDGGLSDPIPFHKAFENGCEKVVIILTKPVEAMPNQNRNLLGASLLKKKYPQFSKAMKAASDVYLNQIKEALQLQNEGRALILAPDDIMGLGTLTRDKDKLLKLYEKGYNDSQKVKPFLSL